MKLNEKGITLVEMLAAVTILGIVIITSMSIFSQMTKFNMKTESKLETMNEARVLLEQIKENPETLCSLNKEENNGAIVFSQKDDNYKYEVNYHLKDDLSEASVDICKDVKQTTPVVRLNKVHIEIKDVETDRLVSETFGYIKY